MSLAHAERFAADIGATVELADPSAASRRWSL